MWFEVLPRTSGLRSTSSSLALSAEKTLLRKSAHTRLRKETQSTMIEALRLSDFQADFSPSFKTTSDFNANVVSNLLRDLRSAKERHLADIKDLTQSHAAYCEQHETHVCPNKPNTHDQTVKVIANIQIYCSRHNFVCRQIMLCDLKDASLISMQIG